MAQAKMAAPEGYEATVSATGHAGAAALGVSPDGGLARDDGTVVEQVVVKDLADGVAGHGTDDYCSADAPKSSAGGLARGHGVVGEVLTDKDLADGVVGHGANDLFALDTAAPFFNRIADAPKSSAGGFARGHGVFGEVLADDKDLAREVVHGGDDLFARDKAALFAGSSRAGAVGERLVDMGLAGVLGDRGEGDVRNTGPPFAVVYKDDIAAPLLAVVDKDRADILARDTAAPFADAAPSSHNAKQVSIDVKIMDGKAGVPAAAKTAAAAGGNLDSAVVGIIAAATAITMFAGAGAVSPPVAFGLFVLLLGGLSLVISSVRGA